MADFLKPRNQGVFFKSQGQPAPVRVEGLPEGPTAPAGQAIVVPGESTPAFVGLFLFTLVLYIRPSEVLPGPLASLPYAKVIALLTPLIYLATRTGRNKLILWTTELKMTIVIAVLGVLHLPVSMDRELTTTILFEVYIKIIIILALLISLITTRERLRALIYLTFGCCLWMAVDAIRAFRSGEFFNAAGGIGRIEGAVGGIFSNPNDLATTFAMMLPIALGLALSRSGGKRILFFIVAGILAAAIIVTFSRGGFLGLIGSGGLFVWKLRKRSKLLPVAAVVLAAGFMVVAMPGGYGDRVATIFNSSADKTESAEGRSKVLKRAADLALRHAAVGVGMGNFFLYSLKNLKAHNAYLEIAAELGAIGFFAYLLMIFGPFRPLARIEERYAKTEDPAGVEIFYLSLGLQGTFVAYYICSFFSSIEYLWFIYYPIAYATSVRRIVEYEERTRSASAEAPSTAIGFLASPPIPSMPPTPAPRQASMPKRALAPARKSRPRGALWRKRKEGPGAG